ncbi:MAG: hypothetical protein FJ395_13540 [Verrucomicrobia bacterium]|nr:hypothetical protein [Verrucomicrobiota bacterium]
MATEADTCRKYVLPKLYAAGWTDDQICERRLLGHLDGLAGQVARLQRLQTESHLRLEQLLPSILDRAFKGEL